MKNVTIEAGYYDNSTFMFLSYSAVHVFLVIYYTYYVILILTIQRIVEIIMISLTDNVLKNSAVF